MRYPDGHMNGQPSLNRDGERRRIKNKLLPTLQYISNLGVPKGAKIYYTYILNVYVYSIFTFEKQ